MGKRLGLALSGGGHRAALWAAGALLGGVGAEVGGDVVSVASVSGGSITNGVVAAGPKSFAAMTTAELEKLLQPALHEWAVKGLFFTGPDTDGYSRGVFVLLGMVVGALVGTLEIAAAIDRGWTALTAGLVGISVLVVTVVVTAFKTKSGGGGRALPFRRELLAGVAVSSLIAANATIAVCRVHGWELLLVGLVVVGVLVGVVTAALSAFGRRSAVVEDALGMGLLRGDAGGLRTLASLATTSNPVHHVLCATNLVTGNHLYLSPRLAYGDGVGESEPAAGLTLALAVQASACLPGAFAPRVVRGTSLGKGLSDVVLTDGGVYDNMADQWELGFANRARRFQDPAAPLSQYQAYAAEELVVVNASKAMGTAPFKATGAKGEVFALLRCKDVLYDQSTATRRRYLVDLWTANAKAGEGPTGALVHIAQTPSTVPSRFVAEPDRSSEQRGRAAEALVFLARLDALEGRTPDDWRRMADDNSSVPTTLGPVGVDIAADLLHHSYVLTRINLFVVLARGTLPPAGEPDDCVLATWGAARFANLVA